MSTPNDRKSGCIFGLAIVGGMVSFVILMDLLGVGMAMFIPWIRQFWQ